jgi:hypothetical protein
MKPNNQNPSNYSGNSIDNERFTIEMLAENAELSAALQGRRSSLAID